ncbi:MAG TPA: VWA domain-containing protein [Gemmatimonadaceae bacterium]|jgi:nitric oxide reductase NorD protein
MQSQFAGRRFALKAQYVLQRARVRVRATFARKQTTVRLDAMHRRLELVLTAAYGRPITIASNERRGWAKRSVFALMENLTTASIDGEVIRLPEEIESGGDQQRGADRYRLLAIEQAERLTRGTTTLAPLADPLERDLYLLREGAAIDAQIARTFPGLARALNEERATTLARRPNPSRLTAAERDVETLLRGAMIDTPDDTAEASENPQASLEWARAQAERIRQRGDRYRGIPLASAWGAIPRKQDGVAADAVPMQNLMPTRKPEPGDKGAPRDDDTRESEADDDDMQASKKKPKKEGKEYDSNVQTDEDTSHVPDAPESDSDSGVTSYTDSPSQPHDPSVPSTVGLPPATYYDEWNSDRGTYLRNGAAVRIYDATGADPGWLYQELRDHAATVRQIKTQFERLRARRTLLPRQPRGDSLDLAACVDAAIDRRLGNSPSDRLYLEARAARRGLAISLLIDASGSTDQRVTEKWRIIDLEKIALMLASQALDALGDLYAIYAFAGRHSSNVKVTVLKDFSESNGETIARRIAALSPGGFTRIGAAVRHATKQLAQQQAGHRLLLLLSDGRPNDLDAYQGPYGVEDSRQAILEARASGVFPYCLTIDQAAAEYLPRIFGNAGHTVLQKPEQLPRALLAVVRGLIKR